jgi:hypothetical protein
VCIVIKAKDTSGREPRKKKPKTAGLRLAKRQPGEPTASDVYVSMMRKLDRELGDEGVVVPAVEGHPRLVLRPSDLPVEGRLVAPTVDVNGVALPRRSVARWHLRMAADLLHMEYFHHREEKGSDDLERAAGVARQLHISLDPAASESDRKCMLRMANEARAFRLKTKPKDAEDALLVVLPEARKRFGEGGTRGLAYIALIVLANQEHAGAGKVQRRWSVTDGTYWNLPKFQEDAEELASEIDEMLLEPELYEGDRFAREVISRMYKLLGLGPALGALKIKERRAKV